MKLYLLRHGQTEGSLRDLYYGAANIPVLPESLEELHAAAQRGVYPKAQRYYTSGLLRTERERRGRYRGHRCPEDSAIFDCACGRA